MRKMARAGAGRTGAKIDAENGGGPRRAAEKALLLGGLAARPSPYPARQAILQAKHIARATQAQLLVHNYYQATDPLGGVMMPKHECFSAALSGSPLFSA